MFYEDLSNYCYCLKIPVATVRNIGWLDSSKKFTTGEVDDSILTKLAEILVLKGDVDVHVNWTRSLDPCALSGKTDISVLHEGKAVFLGGSEVWLPSIKKGEYFAAPSLIYHYIKGYKYLPPKGFLEAVKSFDMEVAYKAQEVYLELIKGHF
ncbi:hypothetical protein ACJJIK_08690 [Microbulbifer sp. ZKSA006]|uniref:DUF7919 family protein n=1 Tax=Microbulbifer sp. ZKSA006 TaxID=3243390 RepID=UPI00403A2281